MPHVYIKEPEGYAPAILAHPVDITRRLQAKEKSPMLVSEWVDDLETLFEIGDVIPAIEGETWQEMPEVCVIKNDTPLTMRVAVFHYALSNLAQGGNRYGPHYALNVSGARLKQLSTSCKDAIYDFLNDEPNVAGISINHNGKFEHPVPQGYEAYIFIPTYTSLQLNGK